MIFFMAFASLRLYGSEKRKKTPMCKIGICRFDGDGILWVYSVVKEQRRFDPSLVPTEKPESYTHIEKLFFEKKKKPSPKLIGKGCQCMHWCTFSKRTFCPLGGRKFHPPPMCSIWAHGTLGELFDDTLFPKGKFYPLGSNEFGLFPKWSNWPLGIADCYWVKLTQ